MAENLNKTIIEEPEESETTQQETDTADLSEAQKNTLKKHENDLAKAKGKKPGLWKRFINSKPIRFVRKHKKEIGVAVGATLLAGGAYYLGRDQGRKEAPSDYLISDGEPVTPLEDAEATETEEVYNNETDEPEETAEVTEE